MLEKVTEGERFPSDEDVQNGETMQGEIKHQFIECAKQLQHLSSGESDRRSLNNLVMGPKNLLRIEL